MARFPPSLLLGHSFASVFWVLPRGGISSLLGSDDQTAPMFYLRGVIYPRYIYRPDNLTANDCFFVKGDHLEKPASRSEKGRKMRPATVTRSLTMDHCPDSGSQNCGIDPSQFPPLVKLILSK